MRAFELLELLHLKMAEKGFGDKEITVHIPNMGAAAIKGVAWHASCDEFHILLKTKECLHPVKTWKGEVGNRKRTCDSCGSPNV